MADKKIIYISGPITGVLNYKEDFEKAEEMLTELGYTVLTPSRLPGGMDNAHYMRIDLAMIDSADAVVFLSGWQHSKGAKLELLYCEYINKPTLELKTRSFEHGGDLPPGVTRAYLDHDLKEVLGE